MKKLAFMVLAVICFVSFIDSTYAATLKGVDIVYARSNLRAQGDGEILWHNMRSFRGLCPVGTEVKITGYTDKVICFVTTETKKGYVVYAADPNQWDKFFVKNKNEIGLDKFSPDTKAKVINCEVANGMTKEEVYASKGCPAYLAWGKKTFKISFNEIIKSDKWYYMTNRHGQDVMVTFENGVVIKTGGFEK